MAVGRHGDRAPASGVAGQTLSYTGTYSDPGTGGKETYTFLWIAKNSSGAQVGTATTQNFDFTLAVSFLPQGKQSREQPLEKLTFFSNAVSTSLRIKRLQVLPWDGIIPSRTVEVHPGVVNPQPKRDAPGSCAWSAQWAIHATRSSTERQSSPARCPALSRGCQR